MKTRNLLIVVIKTIVILSFTVLALIALTLLLSYSHIPSSELVLAKDTSPYFSVRDSSAVQYVCFDEKINCEGLWDKRKQRFAIEPIYSHVYIEYENGHTLVNCVPVEEKALGVCLLLDTKGNQLFRKEKADVHKFSFYTKDIIEYGHKEFFKLNGQPINSYLTFYLTHSWLGMVYGWIAILLSIVFGIRVGGKIADKAIQDRLSK